MPNRRREKKLWPRSKKAADWQRWSPLLEHALSATGHLTVHVVDAEGHGLDRDTPEWRGAAHRTIRSRSALAGTLCLLVAFGVFRPRTKPPKRGGAPTAKETRTDSVFSFHPRWKEELVCACARGSFVLEMPMGVTSVYLPTAARWLALAPTWTVADWSVVHQELSEWCLQERIPLHVDATAHVYRPDSATKAGGFETPFPPPSIRE